MDEIPVIWLLMEGETKKAYDAFCTYRDMGPGRSLKKTVKALGRVEGYIRAIEVWSRRFKWRLRCQAYDQRNEQLKDDTFKAVVVDNQTLWLQRRETVRETGYELADELFKKARQMLAFPITRVTRTEEGQDQKGRYVNNITIEPAKWTVRDIARMADIANRMARLSVDLPTEIVDVTSELMLLAKRKEFDLLPILKELRHQLEIAG